MKRGLVIGKFMPVHAGHLALIQFASSLCDELIISMSYQEDDVIPGQLRFSWLQEIFKDNPKVKPALVKDDFDDESLAWPDRTRVWAEFLKKRYGKIDVMVSSEEYGTFLDEHLGAVHIPFDPARKQIPVSATLIREKPFTYWEYIPAVVRPYFVKKICFYGPESTGKSVMAKQLAAYYQTEFVPEVAREIVSSNEFTINEIIKIGYAQTERIIDKAKTANKILFCDTDLITTQIYCRHYLGEVPDVLYELEKKITYDQYFLFDIDVPWVGDGMRDLGDSRQVMFEIFKQELEIRNISYLLVKGDYKERERFLKSEVNKIVKD
ncbi:MAG TPA: AAA family ATPase [Cyclobacteriaceae bacterium]|mgnify:FL=1|nr:AAA family ATPase [Cyclobacteriaceae bacterium]